MRREVGVAASWSNGAIEVVAPRPDSAVVLKRDAKVTARRNANDICESGNLHRRLSVGGRAITKLATIVGADAPDSLVRFKHHEVIAAGGDRGDICDPLQLHRRRICTKQI